MIINRSLPKSGRNHLSTPNKSPSPLPHKPTPQQTAKSQQVHTHQSNEGTTGTTKTETTPSDPLLEMVHQSIHTSDDDASDISNVLSVKRSRQIQVCQRYLFQHANHTNQQLVEHGPNGGLAGSDMRVIHKTHRKINIQGIDNHEVTGLDVVTAATLLNTSQGKVIGIFNEYAYLWKGSSIHSSGQLEWFKTNVDETSVKVGGTQLINTLDGYSVPLLIKDGLAYATSLGRPTDQDMDTYPHVLSVKRSPQIQVCQCYLFQHANHTNQQLVDRGANGGLAGSDMHVIHRPYRKINIQGIDNHEVTGLDVVTAATLLNTSQGKVIGIFNKYAYLGKGSSIHSSGQLYWFKTNVDETSVKVGGTQLINTLDGYSVPLLIKDGLAYATSLGKPTDQDMDTYPHVFFTSPDEWDPSVLDHDPPHLDGLDPSQVPDQPFGDPMFDAYGDFNERIITNLNILLDAPPEDWGSYTEISSVFTANLHQSSPQEPDWNALHPFFAWTSPSSIKDTFNVTTRHGTAPHTQDYIKKHFKSCNPVFNISRCSEAVATDTIFSDTPAVDDGSTMAQFFCGHDTLVCDAYGIKSTKQFINTLSENIRKRGAMDTPINDGGKYEISQQVTDLLCSLFIQDYQSEPYHQHQNKAENRFGLAKCYTNTVMNTSGCPAFCWLLCLQYICVVLNHLASPTLQGICPIQALQGTTPDVSFMLHFSFYEPVYYRIDSSEPDLNFPSSSNEKKGYWVGFADNQGDSLTWRILTEDTHKIIIRSGVCSTLRTTTNQRLASPSGEGTTLPF